MIKLNCTIFLCLCSFFLNAQVNVFTSKDSIDMFCNKVMQTVAEGKYAAGIQLFRQRSVLDTSTINSIDKNLVEQMTGLQPYYKKLVGYEFIEETAIKNSVAKRRYLLKFENYFLTVDFILYNNGRNSWTISNFNYYDNPKELF